MRYIYLFTASISWSVGFAQSNIRIAGDDPKLVATHTAELNKMLSTTDKTIYDREGNIVDSATASKMVKSLEYQVGYGKPNGVEGYKRMITKIDSAQMMMSFNMTKKTASFRSRNRKMWEGEILDLKPFKYRVDEKKLKGKALLLIFWCDQCYSGSQRDSYSEINDITSIYKDASKLEVLAITHHPYDVALMALKRNPILNALHVFEAGDVDQAYQTDDRPLIILTDKDHKIIYSMAQHAAVTPWMLNKLLKETL